VRSAYLLTGDLAKPDAAIYWADLLFVRMLRAQARLRRFVQGSLRGRANVLVPWC
jgi:hypothetical protein